MDHGERLCSGCGTSLPAGAVYHRFKLVLQGEQELCFEVGTESPVSLLARMESEADWGRYAEDVHWQAQGELCARCRDRLRAVMEDFAIPVV